MADTQEVLPPLPAGASFADDTETLPPLPAGASFADAAPVAAGRSFTDRLKDYIQAPDLTVPATAPNPAIGTAEAYKPTQLDQIRGVVANSAIGRSLEEGLPKVADALNLHPTETVNSPTYEQDRNQLIAPQYAARGAGNQTADLKPSGFEDVATGVGEATGAMTTPGSMAALALPVADVAGLFGETGAQLIPRLVSGGFSLQMLQGLYQKYAPFREALHKGDYATARQLAGQALVEAPMAALTAAHAVHGHPAGKVTGFDHATGLPIVDRSQPAAPPAKLPDVAPLSDPSRTFTAPAIAALAEANVAPGEVKPPSKDLAAMAGEATNQPQPLGGTDKETGRDVLQPTDNPAHLDAAAQAAAPELEQRLGAAVGSIDGAKVDAVRPRKKSGRLVEKLTREGQPAETIPDYLASRVVVDSPKAHDEAVAAIKKQFPVVRNEDLFNEGDKDYGYRRHALQVQLSNGVTAEVHVVPKEVAAINADEHENYKEARDAELAGNTEVLKKATEEAKAKNDAAMEQFNVRNGVQAETKTEKSEAKPESKHENGSTQTNIPDDSDAGRALAEVRSRIDKSDLRSTDYGGDGDGLETEPHVTVRYGLTDDDTGAIERYLRAQAPFEAKLGKTSTFPPGKGSDGAAVIKADVHAPELHRMNAEIGEHGNFKESDFPDYIPHATVAYVKPEAAQKYVGMNETEGKSFSVRSVTISGRDGVQKEIPLEGGKLETRGDRGESPEPVAAGQPAALPKDGQTVLIYGHAGVEDGTPARITHWNLRGEFVKNADGSTRMAGKGRVAIPIEGGSDRHITNVRESEVQPIGPTRLGKSLTGSAREKEFSGRVRNDGAKLVGEYLRANTRDGQLYIGTDQAKKLFPEYVANPTEVNQDVSQAAAGVAQMAWEAALSRPPHPDKDWVKIVVGAPATGKTSTVVGGTEPQFGIVREAIPQDAGYLENMTNEAAASGRRAKVDFSFSGDVRNNVQRMVARAMDTGRVVPLEYLARAWVSVPQALAAFERNLPNVPMIIRDNSGKVGESKVYTGDAQSVVEKYGTTEQVAREAARAELERLKDANEVSGPVYREALSGYRGAEAADTRRAGDAGPGHPEVNGQSEPERAGGKEPELDGRQGDAGFSADRAELGEGAVPESSGEGPGATLPVDERRLRSEPGTGGDLQRPGDDDDLQRHPESGKDGTAEKTDEADEAEVGAPGWFGRMPVAELHVDPRRFQYKLNTDSGGATGKLKDAQWNERLGGFLHVWRDPADGKVYVVNGHHRFDLARRSGAKDVKVEFYPAEINTAIRARVAGAIDNIADNNGTAVDAAKFLRDTGRTIDDLRAMGISVSGPVADGGGALAKLDPSIFDQVASGRLPEDQGIAIGKAAKTPAQQEELVKEIRRAEAKGKPITAATLKELARQVEMAGEHTVETMDLFGGGQRSVGLALKIADVSAYVRKQILGEKKLFGSLTSAAKAETLATQDNKINTGKNKTVAERAAQAAELYDTESARTGAVYDVLKRAAKELTDGQADTEVKKRAYRDIRSALSKTLQRGVPDGGESRSEDARPPGRSAKEDQLSPPPKEATNAKPEAATLAASLRAQGKAVATGKELADGDDLKLSKKDLEDAGQKPMFERAPTWYLKSEKLIDQKMKGPMTGEQVQRMLENGGVKADELKWAGLADFLKGKFRVTPDQVREHLAENALKIAEVTKGGENPIDWKTAPDGTLYTPEGYKIEQMASNGMYRLSSPGGMSHAFESLDEAKTEVAQMRSYSREDTVETRYGSATLPGGENYRELLLTMPGSEGDYKSSHWDEKNILAHVRYNDRVTPDGKKLLHLEEIQSDWHQQGRARGYQEPFTPVDKLPEGWSYRVEKQARGLDKVVLEQNGEEKSSQVLQQYEGDKDAEKKAVAQYNRLASEEKGYGFGTARRPPDAPFKKDWHEMAFRRMVRMAAENGYDGVSWTPGEQQADRYSLAQKIDHLRWSADGALEGFDAAGKRVLQQQVPEAQLGDFVGKDVAKKIIDSEPDAKGWVNLPNADLKMGGEGMKGFYDKIIPDYARKFGRQWGAKVGEQTLSGEISTSHPWVVRDGATGELIGRHNSEDDADGHAETHFDGGRYATVTKEDKPLKVPYLEITPEMRNAVTTEGVAMFRRGGGDDSGTGNFFAVPADGDDAPIVHIDGQVRNALNDLDPELAEGGKWPAASLPKSTVDKLVEKLRLQGGTLANRLADVIDAARDAKGNTILLTPAGADSVGEEQFHGFQHRQGTQLGDVMLQIGQSPEVLKAQKYLRGRGYSGSLTEAAQEATAKTFNGDWAGAGLTRNEGAALLKEFLDAVVTVRGKDALTDLPTFRSEMADVIEEAYERHQVPKRERSGATADESAEARREPGGRGGEGVHGVIAEGSNAGDQRGARQQRLFQRGADGRISLKKMTQDEPAEERLIEAAREDREKRIEVAEKRVSPKTAARVADREAELAERAGKKPVETTDATREKFKTSALKRLQENVATKPKVAQPISKQLKDSTKASGQAFAKDVKSSLQGLQTVRERMADAWENLRHPKRLKTTSYMQAFGDYELAKTESILAQHALVKELTEKVPDKAVRAAMSDWIQAGGDMEKLKYREQNSRPEFRDGYRMAQELTRDQKLIANDHKRYFDEQEHEAKAAGFVEQGKADYLMQIYDNHGKPGLQSLINYGALKDDPSIFEHSTFRNYFEAESAGQKPKDKDLGWLTATYDKVFGEAVRSRAFIKQLLETREADGRPTAILRRDGNIMQIGPDNEPYLMDYKHKDDGSDPVRTDYVWIDHPVMRSWLWNVGEIDESELTKKEIQMLNSDTAIALRGDVLVHPEIAKHLKNFLSTSAVRKTPVLRELLWTSRVVKDLMFTGSGTHQVIESTLALHHGISPINLDAVKKMATLHGWANPFRLDDKLLDLNEGPNVEDKRLLVRNGLMLADFPGEEAWSEAMTSGAIRYMGPIGRILGDYRNFMFRDMIPKFKMAMALKVLKADKLRYSKTMDLDQIAQNTARQANATFSGINWQRMGVSPTAVDLLRLSLLAPDFEIGQVSTYAQAFRRGGAHQRIAFARAAIILWTTSRVMNYLLNDGDMKMNADDAFRIVYKGKAYGIRTPVSDAYSMVNDPRMYLMHRLNPVVARTAMEAMTGKDEFGRAKTTLGVAADTAKTAIPIVAQNFFKNQDIDWQQSFLGAMGVHDSKYYTPAETLAHKLRIGHIPSTLQDEEEAAPSREARRLENGLRDGTMTTTDLWNAVNDGKITAHQAGTVQRNSELTPLVKDFKALGLKEALDVYDRANTAEKDDLKPLLEAKSKELNEKTPDVAAKLESRLEKVFEATP